MRISVEFVRGLAKERQRERTGADGSGRERTGADGSGRERTGPGRGRERVGPGRGRAGGSGRGTGGERVLLRAPHPGLHRRRDA
ncbi:hypothetical protein E3T25_10335 [Cryobacterium sandaracinum]|uniref:Uncharacterized protein n=1 Tax=Cryobacterium sandaracinum TaxID=1259247 RepID=A0ABY2JAT3_9MICO|nr:hypothetical protein E3T25_10335 [Cryobacterium sandaracinum]